MSGQSLRVLLIQSWVVPGAEIRDALRSAGYHPQLYRVDFEAALVSALARNHQDIVLLDSKSSGLSRSVVEAQMRVHTVRVPLLEVGADLATLVRTIQDVLAAARN